MSRNNPKSIVEELLAHADVKVNGDRPWDIQVHNEKLYSRVLAQGNLGLGEAYMDGWWDCEQVDEFIDHVLSAKLDKKVRGDLRILAHFAKSKIFNQQTKRKSKKDVQSHYDIGNDLYSVMLDKGMNYSCGFWRDQQTLDNAQIAKLDMICRKIGLQPGMRVWDIGCGWGGFAKFAAENYDVEVVGVTLSENQAPLARQRCKGLPVEILLQDYTKVKGKFDRIVSIGMAEHVGHKNYKTYMKKAHDSLTDDGMFLLHTIGSNKSIFATDPWTHKFIFPGGMLPSGAQLMKASEGLFVMEDWHNFGADYDPTLMAWHKNFNDNWHKIKDNYEDRVDGKFKRMWDYYLLSCAGSFRARNNQLWQIMFSKEGVRGGYHRPH